MPCLISTPRLTSRRIAAALGAVLLFGQPALAGGATTLQITIKDHKFDPAELHVHANNPTILIITNADATSEEFDSTALGVEKVLLGGQKGAVWLRPLAPGSYAFMGEYHPDTAKGVVIAE
jgi:Cupredoxin-like domain